MQGEEYGKLVSIVVPVYNAEKYLGECVDTLLAQTYPHFEILLIDDGSKDNSGKICDGYANREERVRVFHQKNAGPSAARNQGIDQARGEYLIFVDADDCIHRRMLDIYMENAGKEEVLICELSEDSEALEKTEWEMKWDQFSRSNFMDLFSDGHVNSPCNKLFSVKIIRENRIHFPDDMDLGEDLIFNLEYLKYAPSDYRVFRTPLYYYRKENEESLSSAFREDLFDLQMVMFKAIQNFMEEKNVFEGMNRKQYYQVYWNRLFLTYSIYRDYGKTDEKGDVKTIMTDMMADPIWNEVWENCRRENAVTFKMFVKRMCVLFPQIRAGRLKNHG